MCLTIPKKVVEIKEDFVIVETFKGTRQEVKSIIDIKVGDYVLTQQNVIVQQIDKQYAQELLDIFEQGGKKDV